MASLINLIFFVAGFFGVLFAGWKVCNARTWQLFAPLVSRVNTNEKVVALTFDDGPSADVTDSIALILRDVDVRATFFLTGHGIITNPDIARVLVRDGHEIGNHSFSHKRMIFKTINFIRQEILQTDMLIRQIGYFGPIHFRPPYCKKLIVLPWVLCKLGKLSITWNIEPETKPQIAKHPKLVEDYVVDNIKPGSIILLHCTGVQGNTSKNSIRGIVKRLREKGYRFYTVSELLMLSSNFHLR